MDSKKGQDDEDEAEPLSLADQLKAASKMLKKVDPEEVKRDTEQRKSVQSKY